MAAVTLRVPFNYVNIIGLYMSAAAGDNVGSLSLTPEYGLLLQDSDPPDAIDRQKMENLVIVAIAGEAGQADLERRSCDIKRCSAKGDLDCVKKLTSRLYDDPVERDAFIKTANRRCLGTGERSTSQKPD